MGFRRMLEERQKLANTRVCVGLDPLLEKLPKCFRSDVDTVTCVKHWMWEIAKATAEYASMFKPQIAHWEALEPAGAGIEALQEVIENIHSELPGIPVLLDSKRGDIARTQKQYGVAILKNLGADGMNFCPYMGKDTMAALVDNDNPGKALVGLCYTSNPDARQVQDAVMADGRPLWEYFAEWILQWAEECGVVEDAGLVMAAAYGVPKDLQDPKGPKNVYSAHLTRCRQLVGNKFWHLIPGIGAQQGFVDETVLATDKGPGSFAINSSSEICFASSGADFAEAAAKKAKELRDSINQKVQAF
jgi:orotidine-5'-phosphate decarboxylase